jgi:hypothetical protein
MEIDCRVPLEWAGVVVRDAKYGRMFSAAMNEFISTAGMRLVVYAESGEV